MRLVVDFELESFAKVAHDPLWVKANDTKMRALYNNETWDLI